MEAKTSEIHLEKSSVSDTNTSISCVTSSSSGRYIACGTSGSSEGDEDDQGDGLIRIYDTHRAKIAQVAYSGQVDVNEVSFSPCENYIVSAAADNTAIVFDRRFLGSVNKSYFEKLSPVWDQRASRPVHILRHEVFEDEPADAGLTSMLWCNGMIPQMSGYWQGFKESGGFGARPYGSRTVLATGGGDSVVRVWDLGRATEDAEMMTWETRGGPIGSMVATPDFDQLFVGGDIGQVTMISMDRNLKDQYCKVPLRMLEDD